MGISALTSISTKNQHRRPILWPRGDERISRQIAFASGGQPWQVFGSCWRLRWPSNTGKCGCVVYLRFYFITGHSRVRFAQKGFVAIRAAQLCHEARFQETAQRHVPPEYPYIEVDVFAPTARFSLDFRPKPPPGSPLDRQVPPRTSICTKNQPRTNSQAILWHPKTPARLPSGTRYPGKIVCHEGRGRGRHDAWIFVGSFASGPRDRRSDDRPPARRPALGPTAGPRSDGRPSVRWPAFGPTAGRRTEGRPLG